MKDENTVKTGDFSALANGVMASLGSRGTDWFQWFMVETKTDTTFGLCQEDEDPAFMNFTLLRVPILNKGSASPTRIVEQLFKMAKRVPRIELPYFKENLLPAKESNGESWVYRYRNSRGFRI